MTEQGNKQERQNIDQQLWALASSFLEQKPDLDLFPPDRIEISHFHPQQRQDEIRNSCFE